MVHLNAVWGSEGGSAPGRQEPRHIPWAAPLRWRVRAALHTWHQTLVVFQDGLAVAELRASWQRTGHARPGPSAPLALAIQRGMRMGEKRMYTGSRARLMKSFASMIQGKRGPADSGAKRSARGEARHEAHVGSDCCDSAERWCIAPAAGLRAQCACAGGPRGCGRCCTARGWCGGGARVRHLGDRTKQRRQQHLHQEAHGGAAERA
jgi:hypothetical protein